MESEGNKDKMKDEEDFDDVNSGYGEVEDEKSSMEEEKFIIPHKLPRVNPQEQQMREQRRHDAFGIDESQEQPLKAPRVRFSNC